jgi:hypothetical protein
VENATAENLETGPQYPVCGLQTKDLHALPDHRSAKTNTGTGQVQLIYPLFRPALDFLPRRCYYLM